MAALSGRKVVVGKGDPATTVAAGRTKSLTINNEPIDITSDDDAGLRLLIEDEAAMESIDMSFEGITKNDTFIAALSSGSFTDDYEIEITGIGTITCRFFVTSVAINAPYNEATTFSAEFQSTGDWTYSAAA